MPKDMQQSRKGRPRPPLPLLSPSRALSLSYLFPFPSVGNRSALQSVGRAGQSPPSHVLWLMAKWPSGSILGYRARRLIVISPSDHLGLCTDPSYREEARCHCIHNPEIKTKLSRSSLMDL